MKSKRKICGIYLLEIENKKYVGQSFDINKRYSRHLYDLNKGRHPSYYFQRTYNKYRVKPELTILWEAKEMFINKQVLTIMEQCYMNLFNPSLNILPANCSRKGIKSSEETILKLKKSHKNLLAKNFSLYHPKFGNISGFNISSFCKENKLSSGAVSDVLNGKSNHTHNYFKSRESYLKYIQKPFKFPGVDKVKNKFKARIKRNKKVWHLGYFNNEKEAYEARIIALNIY